MAKKIKFNLVCDGYPIRTIEDLQNHFAIEDVLDYYTGEDHLFHRWLELREYKDELLKVMSITETEPREIIKKLAIIFAVEMDEDDIDSYFRTEAYRKERDKRNSAAAKTDLSIHAILESYRLGYQQHIESLGSKDKKDRDFAVNKIVSDYMWAFEMDLSHLIENLKAKNDVAAILGLLGNEKARKYLVDQEYGLKYELEKWVKKEDFRKEASKAGFVIKYETVKNEKYKILEEVGVICLVLENEYDVHFKGAKMTKEVNSCHVRLLEGLSARGDSYYVIIAANGNHPYRSNGNRP